MSVNVILASQQKGYTKAETDTLLATQQSNIDQKVPLKGMGKNLLDNWYFHGFEFPINQNGIEEFTESSPSLDSTFIDRWSVGSSFGTYKLLKGFQNETVGIQVKWPAETQGQPGDRLSIMQSINGRLEHYINQPLTLTVATINPSTNNIYIYSGTAIYQNSPEMLLEVLTQHGFATLAQTTVHLGVFAPPQGEEAEEVFCAVKLEIGTQSTLAKVVNGEFQFFYDFPNYAEEYCKCSCSREVLDDFSYKTFDDYKLYGLGTWANKAPIVVNADDCTETGWYATDNTTLNLPSGLDSAAMEGLIFCIARGDVFKYQEYYDFVNKNKYIRWKNSNGWENTWALMS